MADDQEAARRFARELAWRHFDLHAKQRIEVFKSYLTLTAVIFAGYGVAIQTKLNSIGLAIAFFSIVISILFWFLDQRTRELVKLSEEYLKGDEKYLSGILNDKAIALFSESDRLSEVRKICGMRISYGRVLSTFFLTNIALAFLLGCWFLYSQLIVTNIAGCF